MVYQQAPGGAMIPAGIRRRPRRTAGPQSQLTLDTDLQYLVQNAVDSFGEAIQGAEINAVVMDVKTGHVLSMYGTPGYDPNNPGAAPAARTQNPASPTRWSPVR